jgi:hypothetical protein
VVKRFRRADTLDRENAGFHAGGAWYELALGERHSLKVVA